MMIAPAHATGPSVRDLVAQTTQLWSQALLAPLAWLASPPPSVTIVEPPPPALSATASTQLKSLAATAEPVTDHALLVLLGHFARHLGLLDLLEAVQSRNPVAASSRPAVSIPGRKNARARHRRRADNAAR